MGNRVSASKIIIAPKIRVVQASDGRVVDVQLPLAQSSMTVGELMLEFPPGHFVAHLNLKPDLLASTGKRATPLGADADAKPGAVYVLFPMPRLHTRITPQELLFFAKLLHLQDQQLTKATHNPFKAHVLLGRFTTRARVAPLVEKECKNAHYIYRDADSEEQACPLPMISFRKQQSEQESMCCADSSLSCISSSCHGHMGLRKLKPWAPKLQTIMESS